MDQKDSKGLIVGVGFQKTGTTTLRDALTILGYRVKDTSRRPLIPILKGNFRRVHKMLVNYDAVEDTPWYKIYKEIDQMFPGSKFILTLRDEESWYKSISNHIADLRSANHEYIYGRGKGLPKDDKENTLRVYRTHYQEVKEYFRDRPEDLLLMDFKKGDGWNKLCNFLGKEVPELEFPHSNKGKSLRKEGWARLKFMRQQFKNSMKIWYIDLLGLWDKPSVSK